MSDALYSAPRMSGAVVSAVKVEFGINPIQQLESRLAVQR